MRLLPGRRRADLGKPELQVAESTDAYVVHPGPDCNDASAIPGSGAKNVILFIGDGMGFGHLRAARCFKNGNPAPLVLETLPESAELTTFSASDAITDSAAGATAMATGRKVYDGVLSVALPGDGSDLLTVLERRKALGNATGLVTILVCSMADGEPTAPGALPDCTFTSGGHTEANVPLFAVGAGAENVAGTLDNTDIYALTAGIGP